eukprot:CAMPEP_0170311342 /NCGR_PEP_ID=MMETSP0116_2-20130129/56177_1 /TAXON_ID=400756 /ORGANISM="Durinskia baltica, Strain CSIRO CS-38" /LENGTH=203 /DNA_ID=CAMNT_0010563657 /DNA_START=134 /DNA_END=742 /DNA_ORIENTATION=-
MVITDVADHWNVTQAIVRKSSGSIEECLLLQCAMLAVVLPLMLMDVMAVGSLPGFALGVVPAAVVAGGVLCVLLLAAAVSDKCARVPSLINAMDFGEGTSSARQEIVAYIASSAAGFYVFGVRIHTGMVLKFMYTWCVITVAVASRILVDDSLAAATLDAIGCRAAPHGVAPQEGVWCNKAPASGKLHHFFDPPLHMSTVDVT